MRVISGPVLVENAQTHALALAAAAGVVVAGLLGQNLWVPEIVSPHATWAYPWDITKIEALRGLFNENPGCHPLSNLRYPDNRTASPVPQQCSDAY
ncbi:MAG TPA: hypothetical protein VJ757_13200 [Pseudonocardiaceae bacterium]|nr:hypothetical protein [Pseudonocardiaceae bacterium]